MALKIFIGILVAVLVGGYTFGFYRTIPGPDKNIQTMASTTITTVTIGATTVAVTVAGTENSREQGLSGQISLADGAGMLFMFDTPGNYGFWMKDMNFPIDMLFIDAKGVVVTVHANATPESYRQNPPQVFYPASDVQYVLEVPAGFAHKHGIVEGQTATFK